MRLPALLLLAALALVGTATAQEATCYSTPGYVVAVSENVSLGVDELGQSIAIHKTAAAETGPCSFDADTADIVLHGNYDFTDITGTTLIMSEASSRQHLFLFDIETGIPFLSLEAVLEGVTPTELTYWEYGEDGVPATCPEYETYKSNGGLATIAREVKYDLSYRRAVPTGKLRCDYQQ